MYNGCMYILINLVFQPVENNHTHLHISQTITVLPFSLPFFCRFGDISLQERINQKNFEILDGYFKTLSDKVPSECESISYMFSVSKHA